MTIRTLKEIKIADVQKRKVPSKHYVYVIRVTWSDESINVVYRRYSKFFDLQTKLLEEFPEEGGVDDPSKRVLPFLPGKILFGRSHVRDVAIKRKEPIQEYCTKLIALPSKISQSDLVVMFFEPRSDDIELPAEKKKKKKDTADVISDPVSLEQYVAIADYQKQNRNEITMVAGDVVEVIDKNENGWWFVNLDEEQGWVPAAYMESADGHSDDISSSDAPTNEVGQYITATSYRAELDDEMSFEIGVIVNVVQKNFDGWWLIRYQDKEGWAPAMYLKKPDPSQLHAAEVGGGLPKKVWVGAASAPASVRSPVQKPAANVGNKGKRVPPRKASVKRSFKKPISISNISYGKGIEAIRESSLQSPEAEYFTVGDFQALGIQSGLTFDKGESVEVLDKTPNGWWYGKIGGHEGWIPSSYLGKREKVKELPGGASPKPPRPVVPDLGTKPKPARPQVPDTNAKRNLVRPQLPNEDSKAKLDRAVNARPKPAIPRLPDSKKPNRAITNSSQSPGGIDFRNNLKASLAAKTGSHQSGSTSDADELYTATADYNDDTVSVLSLKEGDVVMVIDNTEGEWWLSRVNGREGWVPASYLTKEKTTSPVKHALKPQNVKPVTPLRPTKPVSRSQVEKPVPPAKPAKPVFPRPAAKHGTEATSSGSPKAHRMIDEMNTRLVKESKSPIAPPRNESKGYVPKLSKPDDDLVTDTTNITKGVNSMCIATTSYSHEGSDGISFREGDEFEFLEDSRSGWWLVKAKCGQENWAPASHLAMYAKPVKPARPKPPKPAKQVYVAMAAYCDADDNTFSFAEGDEMEVTEQDDSGWWLVQVDGKSGWAPSNYLKPI